MHSSWLTLCALVSGAAGVLIEPLLGGGGFIALTRVDINLRIVGGVVVVVSALFLLMGAREYEAVPRAKSSSHKTAT